MLSLSAIVFPLYIPILLCSTPSFFHTSWTCLQLLPLLLSTILTLHTSHLRLLGWVDNIITAWNWQSIMNSEQPHETDRAPWTVNNHVKLTERHEQWTTAWNWQSIMSSVQLRETEAVWARSSPKAHPFQSQNPNKLLAFKTCRHASLREVTKNTVWGWLFYVLLSKSERWFALVNKSCDLRLVRSIFSFLT